MGLEAMKRQYSNVGATHTESKFNAIAQAQADKAPDFDPDRKGKGVGHVALLESAIAERAAAHWIKPVEYRALIGWVAI